MTDGRSGRVAVVIPALNEEATVADVVRAAQEARLVDEVAVAPDFVHGYRIEAALNSLAAERGLRVDKFVCPGLWHRPKGRKLGPVHGFVAKVSMLLTAVLSHLLWRVRRRRAAAATRGTARVRR